MQNKIVQTLLLLAVMLSANLNAAYVVGDIVTDFTFKDTNLDSLGSIITTDRTVHGIIDQKKLVFMTFFYPG